MKSLSKIFARYLMTALIIILVTLLLNVVLYVIAGFQIIRSSNHTVSMVRTIAGELQISDDEILLSDNGLSYLEQIGYEWAMLLDDSGNVTWDWNLPENLNHHYTPNQIASFSKWYLDDYPVTERVTDYGLLVIASPKGSLWKQNFTDSVERIKFLFHMIPLTFLANLIFVFLLSIFLGFLFYRSLKTIAVGIERLSRQETIHLPQKGMTEMLARQLNRTSDLLAEQKKRLDQRDNARTTWISGVSHDIRTPLSLIMGYASALKEDSSLSGEQRHQAEMIQIQSLQIKRLIEDLNLTSKLEYEMQPLRQEDFSPSRLLRQLVSDFYNQGLSDTHIIDLYIDPKIEQLSLSGDVSLITRAFRNLIQNSIRHNPNGCTVTVTAYLVDENLCFQFSDDGPGIPENVIASLTGSLPDTEKAPHIMGLRIVWQICKAHGWQMIFTDAQTIHILCPRDVNSTPPTAPDPRKKRTSRAE